MNTSCALPKPDPEDEAEAEKIRQAEEIYRDAMQKLSELERLHTEILNNEKMRVENEALDAARRKLGV